MNNKKSFYPNEEVELYLEEIPKGQFSSRINELIMKGLTYEYQEKVKQVYARFSEQLENEKVIDKKSRFSQQLLSAKAFEPEDEVDDFI